VNSFYLTRNARKADLKYRAQDDGDVTVLVSGWEEGRSQLVIVSSRTFEFDDQEFTEVCSAAHTGDLQAGQSFILLSQGKPGHSNRHLEASGKF
jgi:hypothetical protein